MRFWSLAGPDEDVLLALSERHLGDLPQVTSPPGTEGAQRAGELQVALDHLRGVRDSYWDYGWRRENRGGGRYPENKLWEAVQRAIWIFSTPANRLMTRHWRGQK